ncbi:unnamed protein product [Acanthoscelides obtectus]|uniref:Uncharacterized protein n=1 Tax=Acanthoscelides obtectus TaxID=200917 RepID=A0A9P0QIA3_ACAOB|nr:unnamed protein product [Acanthoscelides obtectus]CAK1684448.1 hypothetical protein AOBTE_LOCUS34863 [Acanthoscelides obtectus]
MVRQTEECSFTFHDHFRIRNDLQDIVIRFVRYISLDCFKNFSSTIYSLINITLTSPSSSTVLLAIPR